jgi:putative endonuclease
MRGWLNGLLGDRGERYAARYLRRQGFKIVARQYSNRLGEIDLIAVDGPSVVFVEVKTRTSDAAGMPVEAVDERKQRQIVRAALAYLKQHRLLEQPVRFDVVSVLWPRGARRPDVCHYRNAFSSDVKGQLFA